MWDDIGVVKLSEGPTGCVYTGHLVWQIAYIGMPLPLPVSPGLLHRDTLRSQDRALMSREA